VRYTNQKCVVFRVAVYEVTRILDGMKLGAVGGAQADLLVSFNPQGHQRVRVSSRKQTGVVAVPYANALLQEVAESRGRLNGTTIFLACLRNPNRIVERAWISVTSFA
jgi:hypothetical protein